MKAYDNGSSFIGRFSVIRGRAGFFVPAANFTSWVSPTSIMSMCEMHPPLSSSMTRGFLTTNDVAGNLLLNGQATTTSIGPGQARSGSPLYLMDTNSSNPVRNEAVKFQVLSADCFFGLDVFGLGYIAGTDRRLFSLNDAYNYGEQFPSKGPGRYFPSFFQQEGDPSWSPDEPAEFMHLYGPDTAKYGRTAVKNWSTFQVEHGGHISLRPTGPAMPPAVAVGFSLGLNIPDSINLGTPLSSLGTFASAGTQLSATSPGSPCICVFAFAIEIITVSFPKPDASALLAIATVDSVTTGANSFVPAVSPILGTGPTTTSRGYGVSGEEQSRTIRFLSLDDNAPDTFVSTGTGRTAFRQGLGVHEITERPEDIAAVQALACYDAVTLPSPYVLTNVL